MADANASNFDGIALLGGATVSTLTGNLTLTTASQNFQKIDPNGARDVVLPAEASSNGMWFTITNVAGGAEDISVKDDGGATIVTISQNEQATVICDGTSWVHMGIITIAAS